MIKIDKNALHLILICAAGIILNLIGSYVAQIFHLPIYLDTIGTVFIAALGGYVPGIAVGFFTNLIGSLINRAEIYYGIVSVSLAALTAFLAGRGYYKKFLKVLLTIPATILVTTIIGLLIEEFMSFSFEFKFDSSLAVSLGKHLLENFSSELPDKSISIIIAFFALKIVPPDIKKIFHRLGKMQAPVSDNMRHAISVNSKFVTSLRTKMVLNLMLITLFIALMISAISYSVYRNSAIKEREQIAEGIISIVVNEIDPKRVDEFLEKGYQAEGYAEVRQRLKKIRNSNSDVKFLYVYKIMEDGCHVVFDLDTASVEAAEVGSIEEFDESFKELIPDLLAGRPIRPLISDDTYGYLLTIYKPVYDTEGHCVCYAGIDFSMDRINDYGRMFIVRVITIFSGALILIFVLVLSFIENNIILPVNTMAYCARNFAYDSEVAREHNIEQLQRLEIKTNDEIENLYSAFLKTTADSMNYFENFKRSKIQLAVMEELVHKDALTGLKNKTAYNETTTALDEKIFSGNAAFAIIMIDVNFLKRVNDTYGHEYGNEYLINAAKLACKIFGEELVYRIGGDEFVVVLDGDNLARCDELVAQIRDAIKNFASNESLKPWEKISAAIGVAHYQPNVDKNAEEVFKRADADMYTNKLAMKATRKD
ncbi:MAG: diguanylate cyclase [Selenomonadaceae bacterium]|nr:diguanylate cyclase [Selenomonadaceae bacterium]